MFAFAGNTVFGFEILTALKVLAGLYTAVLFLQSGNNKLLDWSGNRAYIDSVFEKTFLRPVSTLLLGVITVLELAAGICSGLGVLFLLTGQGAALAALGLFLGATAILCLFTGMRIAKDYGGAASITGYFVFFMVALALYAV